MKLFVTSILLNLILIFACIGQVYEDTILMKSRSYTSIYNINMKTTYTGIDSLVDEINFHKMKQINSIGEIRFEYVGYKDSIVYRIYSKEKSILKSYPFYIGLNETTYSNFDEYGKKEFILDTIQHSLVLGKKERVDLIKLNTIDLKHSIYIKPGYGWVAILLDGTIIWWDSDFFNL